MILNYIYVYLTKLDLQFRAFGSQVRNLSTKNDLEGFIRGFRGFRGFRTFPYFPADSAEMVQPEPVRAWVLHAPGAKMTVVYTNSLKKKWLIGS